MSVRYTGTEHYFSSHVFEQCYKAERAPCSSMLSKACSSPPHNAPRHHTSLIVIDQPLPSSPRPMQATQSPPAQPSYIPRANHHSGPSRPHIGPTNAHCSLVPGSKLRATCQLLSTDPLCGTSLLPYPALMSTHMIEIWCGAANSKIQRPAMTIRRIVTARRPFLRPMLLFTLHKTAESRLGAQRRNSEAELYWSSYDYQVRGYLWGGCRRGRNLLFSRLRTIGLAA